MRYTYMLKKITHSFNLNTLGPNVQTLSFPFFFTSPSWLYIRAVQGAGLQAIRAPRHPAVELEGKKIGIKKAPKNDQKALCFCTLQTTSKSA